MPTMTAAVIRTAGGPEVLRLEELQIPVPRFGQVLIRVKAFGLNRSELFTRRGLSPDVDFPRVLGIEAVGLVEDAPGGEFHKGDVVATAMGGMGRRFDGGYAEYTCVPANQVQRLDANLPWEKLGALPEMLQTAWGSLFRALDLEHGDRLLIRGGTTSVGLAAASLAKHAGAFVIATTRRRTKSGLLLENGADEVVIDTGNIANEVNALMGGGVDKVMDLVGATTLMDSLRCARRSGVVCMSGIVGDAWAFKDFDPLEAIPSTVRLTVYNGGSTEFITTPFARLVRLIERGQLRINVGRVFRLDQIVEAHQCMENNEANGKIVILT
ncbi:zinc-binding alcohol dehydrogenase family protein [Paraburkholderia sp. C35]|uniref:zinc-binding alcohol dehydrogenase family protein n=1 Tax=Paraburkholderia sp. C35 TaxID=2126993 RepID=UPI000D69BD27|nr:zinc-binding alcohol dehydrogenase family protein [Paraburkholderia sp. C35]